jgi:hypothetical protein
MVLVLIQVLRYMSWLKMGLEEASLLDTWCRPCDTFKLLQELATMREVVEDMGLEEASLLDTWYRAYDTFI